MGNKEKPSSAIIKLKRTCKFPSCKTCYYANHPNNKIFHRFPRDPELCKAWKAICQLSPDYNTANQYICQNHFDDCDYNNAREKARLKWKSVPKPYPRESTQTIIINAQQPLPLPVHNDFITDDDLLRLDRNKYDFSFLSKDLNVNGKGLSEDSMQYFKKIHDNVCSKLSKLKTQLRKEIFLLKTLDKLYNDNRFVCINAALNSVTKDFIDSHLNTVSRLASTKRWTVREEATALSLYRRSPRLYRYLQIYFELPSIKTLQGTLSRIPLRAGIISTLMEYLKCQISTMDYNDRYCTLIFDKMKLSNKIHNEENEQRIYGLEVGNAKLKNHALVFMIRGIHKNYKQIVGYYFVSRRFMNTSLKELILKIIDTLQSIGLKIVATVCNQNPTNVTTLSSLCGENIHYFELNRHRIFTIYDVPQLLISTRIALLRYNIEYESNKFAKFEYMQSAFDLDQRRMFKNLFKLKPEHFQLDDVYEKRKVPVAAALFSYRMATTIATCRMLGKLPDESLDTAEFVGFIDKLFDSLNGTRLRRDETKILRSAISFGSPHLQFWSDVLQKISKWRVIDRRNGKDCTNEVRFLTGWQITIKSIILLWKKMGGHLNWFSLRSLNQDPLENLFSQMREHGAFNAKMTCHQFVDALKTIAINNFSVPLDKEHNCKEDYCEYLGNMREYVLQYSFSKDRSFDETNSEVDLEYEPLSDD